MKLFFSYFNEGRGGGQIRDMDGSHSSSFFIKPPLLSLLIHIYYYYLLLLSLCWLEDEQNNYLSFQSKLFSVQETVLSVG